MFLPLRFIPVSSFQRPAVLSTRQTPAALPRSRKTPVSPGAGHGGPQNFLQKPPLTHFAAAPFQTGPRAQLLAAFPPYGRGLQTIDITVFVAVHKINPHPAWSKIKFPLDKCMKSDIITKCLVSDMKGR